ncbi:hypothetical protein ACFOOM_17885 [Streptomyces echinoruber]|uniref:hypothetical protein n=1 Tax=Streptomyces echinoruber TaxID=68898 RepID=UPI00361C33EA
MTYEPDERRTGDGRPVPPMPEHAPHAQARWDVVTGPGEAGGAPRERWWRRPARRRAATAVAVAAVVATGGAVAYAAGSPGGAGTGSGALPAAASSPAASPSGDGPGARHGLGPWFRLGAAAVHGEATVKDPDTGAWVVRTWQRGTVQKVDGERVTVRSADGASWTWTVGSDVRVHKGDGSGGTGADALRKGETVFLAGTRSGNGTRTAALAAAGSFLDRKDDGRGGFPWHHKWHRDDDGSPASPTPPASPAPPTSPAPSMPSAPSDSGATT